jgi:hypothetical protein
MKLVGYTFDLLQRHIVGYARLDSRKQRQAIGTRPKPGNQTGGSLSILLFESGGSEIVQQYNGGE